MYFICRSRWNICNNYATLCTSGNLIFVKFPWYFAACRRVGDGGVLCILAGVCFLRINAGRWCSWCPGNVLLIYWTERKANCCAEFIPGLIIMIMIIMILVYRSGCIRPQANTSKLISRAYLHYYGVRFNFVENLWRAEGSVCSVYIYLIPEGLRPFVANIHGGTHI